MAIENLDKRPTTDYNKRMSWRFKYLGSLLAEIRLKELPEEVTETINDEIRALNELDDTDKAWGKKLRKAYNKIINRLARKAKLVPRHYHRNQWIGIGMAAFGAPIGVSLGLSIGNMAFIGLGLPIGLAIGIVIGTSLDNKANEEGRQLDIDMNI